MAGDVLGRKYTKNVSKVLKCRRVHSATKQLMRQINTQFGIRAEDWQDCWENGPLLAGISKNRIEGEVFLVNLKLRVVILDILQRALFY